MVSRNELNGFGVDRTKVEVYLAQLLVWIMILITTMFVCSLFTLVIRNILLRGRPYRSGPEISC